ncbi:MAG: PLP-dependent cysteine synthase family protein [Oscillospiraceae bacterium]
MGILDLIGNTPLINLEALTNRKDVTLYAKAELLNFSGSVKDRAARAMISDGIATGALTEGKTIIDATSGNTGIAYAMIGAALGYKVKLCMPANVTAERKKIMLAYGTEIVETSPLEGIVGAYDETRRIIAEAPEKYFYPDQYSNKANWLAHYNGTGEEIWRQTKGKITHFIAGTGTAGTFVGCTKRLKEYNPGLKAIMMVPDSPFHGIEGIKHRSAHVKSSFFDESIADEAIEVTTEQAYDMTRRLARKYGIFAGISSGANITAALKAAENAPEGSVLVTVICDGGCRYLSNPVWEKANQ